jgi:prepilin-type N-terminal cleavage/methylation domain-containing protein
MNSARGFTLIELAIVLVIITILVGGLAVPLSAQIQARRVAETRHNMEAIHDALIGYAMSHTFNHPAMSGEIRHHLPCPDTDNDGLEDARVAGGSCSAMRGGLPWITLGVRGEDAWGNRYTYAVDPVYSNNVVGFASTPAATQANLDIFPNASCAAPTVQENVPVVVASHGPQGRGALNMNGGTPLAPTSVAADERQNLNVAIGSLPCTNATSFVSHTPTDDFDDLVMWLSSNELFSRVCPAGGCP